MPSLDLAQAAAIAHAGRNLAEISHMGRAVWRLPPDPTLADYYGIGPGQIPADWRVDDPQFYAGTTNIDMVRNDGGAGALFQISGPESSRQVTFDTENKFAYHTGGTVRSASFTPNKPDAAGVHFLMAVRFAGSGAYVFDTSVYIRISDVAHAGGVTTGYMTIFNGTATFPFSVPATTIHKHLVEVRNFGGTVSAYLDGQLLGAAPAEITSFEISGLRMSGGWGFGRAISAICAVTSPEPAVLLARQTLADLYGVPLP